VKSILEKDSSVKIECWGGDKMADAGARVVKHVNDLAFMGFIEVIANIFEILSNFELCRKQVAAFKPDAVVLIDYPGFNLRMAKHIHDMGIPVVYYISPQIWAWKESRVNKVKKYVDHVYVILPFERAFYLKHGVNAEFVGHPLLDEIKEIPFNRNDFLARHSIEGNRPIICVLPGSRKQEIKKILPQISALVEKFPNHQIVVSKVRWQPKALYESILHNRVLLIEGDVYHLLHASEAAVVTSGTATLETALIGTPQVVVYKANWLSIFIARFLVKIRFISLVNLIMDREVVKELIQGGATNNAITEALNDIIIGGSEREQILDSYRQLRGELGQSGASEIVATRLLKIIE
jgi:lipid-A-disaccharide synthase